MCPDVALELLSFIIWNGPVFYFGGGRLEKVQFVYMLSELLSDKC